MSSQRAVSVTDDTDHRLRGSGSTVVTMTNKVNGKTEILTPCRSETPENIEAKLGVIDYVMDPYNLAIFCGNRSKGVCSPYHRLRGSGSTVVTMTSKVNGKTEILTPCRSETPENIEAKLGVIDYVMDPYNLAIFCGNRSKGVCSPYW